MVEINLLPKQYRKSGERDVWQYASIGLGVLTLLLIGIPELLIGNVLSGKQRQLDDQNAQIATLQRTVTPEFNRLTQEKTRLGLIDQTVQALTATKSSYWSTDLAGFINALPSGNEVHISSLKITEPAASTASSITPGKTVTRNFDVSGMAPTSEAVVNFLNAYESKRYGVNLHSAQTDQSTKGSATYTFSADVDQYAPEEPVTAPTPSSGVPAAPGGQP